MSPNKLTEFLDVFKDLEDPRSHRNRRHTMSEILLVTLCAAVCGAEGWQDVEDFGKSKESYLRSILPYKNGIPSDDTYRRFFRGLNPDRFQELFRLWVVQLRGEASSDVIAIDGKSSRHSFDDDRCMLHMISAFATQERLVLAQESVDKKSNEIKSIPKLLEWLDVRGSTVTIDAMGCQHAIGKQIIAQGGDYILALKGNQHTLHEDVAAYFSDPKLCSSLPGYEHWDKGHGRLERRVCTIERDVAWLKERHPAWKTIRSIIRIESTRILKNTETREVRYYIASSEESPQKALKKIRQHWAIENSLHWVLDMSFGEDQSRIRKHNAPQIMAIIRHIALNLLQAKKNSMKRQSIKRLRKMAGWSDQILSDIISQNFS